MIKHISTKDELDQLIAGNEKILIDFYAVWCGPCNMLSPTVEALSNEHEEITVIKVDVDHAPELAQLFHVEAIPTLVFIENGDVVDRKMGFMSKAALYKFCKID